MEVVDEKPGPIKCGKCDLIMGKDEKGRPTLTPYCPPDKEGQPDLSEELKQLRDAFQSEEVVLKPPKVKKGD